MTKINREIKSALTIATDISFEVNIEDMVNFANKVDPGTEHVHQEIIYFPENFKIKIKPLAIDYLKKMNINYDKIMDKLDEANRNNEDMIKTVEYILSHMNEYTTATMFNESPIDNENYRVGSKDEDFFTEYELFDVDDSEVEQKEDESKDSMLVEVIAYNVYGKLFENKEDAEFEKELKDIEIKDLVSDLMKIQDILAMSKTFSHTISLELNNSYKKQLRKNVLNRVAYKIGAKVSVKEELNSYYIISSFSFPHEKLTEDEIKDIVINELKEINKYSN